MSTSPINGANTLIDPAMEATWFPIIWASDKFVFHWIVVDVIKVSFVVIFIINDILPEATLSDTATSPFLLAGSDSPILIITTQIIHGETFLDDAPTTRIVIIISRRSGPDRMSLIRQENDCVQFERPIMQVFADRIAEDDSVCRNVKSWSPAMSDNREEIRTTGDMYASIIWHSHKLAQEEGRQEPALQELSKKLYHQC